jgi:hypothetical protein
LPDISCLVSCRPCGSRAAVLLLAHTTYINVKGMLTLVGEKALKRHRQRAVVPTRPNCEYYLGLFSTEALPGSLSELILFSPHFIGTQLPHLTQGLPLVVISIGIAGPRLFD